MAEYLDFFNIYVIGFIEGTFQFYFLFGVCAVIVTRFLSVGTVTGFVAMVFLLTVCGILVCHAIKMEPVIYTKTGEALKSESGTNISVSV